MIVTHFAEMKSNSRHNQIQSNFQTRKYTQVLQSSIIFLSFVDIVFSAIFFTFSEICVLSIGAFTASKRPPAEEKTIEEFIGRLQEREETTHATD